MQNPIPAFDAATVTAQEVFDFVALKIITQGRPSADVNHRCQYRLPVYDEAGEIIEILKCAAGQLLPDDEYSEKLETEWADIFAVTELRPNFSELYRRFAGLLVHDEGVYPGRPAFLRALQRAHDDASNSDSPDDHSVFLARYRDDMRALAAALNLDDTILRFREPTPRVTTIPGIDMATASEQDVFDFVAVQIIKQGKPSMDEKGRCRYRSPDGCKCGAGQILPDAEYNVLMEGQKAHVLTGRLLDPRLFSPTLCGWAEANPRRASFLDTLQGAHDSAAIASDFLAEYRVRMRGCAALWSLDASILRYREVRPGHSSAAEKQPTPSAE